MTKREMFRNLCRLQQEYNKKCDRIYELFGDAGKFLDSSDLIADEYTKLVAYAIGISQDFLFDWGFATEWGLYTFDVEEDGEYITLVNADDFYAYAVGDEDE